MFEQQSSEARSTQWQWMVAGLLLLATMINYMDRQTLSNVQVRIKQQFELSEQQYGNLEAVFGVAFAVGSLLFGTLADRISVRILYPIVLVGWSAVGFITGMSEGYWSLFICRGLLGIFEAGHWPCALIVTQSVMSRSDRSLGNSILQSGASLGAIITPQIIRLMVTNSTDPNAWRMPFFVIGAVGVVWAVAWLLIIRPGDLPTPSLSKASNRQGSSFGWIADLLGDRRFYALALMVICLNTAWQLVRAWLPAFMQQGRGYSESAALNFNSLFYLATDVGCILAGFAALWLARRGMRVHHSRVLVFAVCGLLAGLTSVAVTLPQGLALQAVLLVVGAGLLGLFPCYYSFTQEMPKETMGRMTGLLSFIGWMASAPMQSLFGAIVDKYKSYDLVLGIVGWVPFIGLVLFLCIWPRSNNEPEAE
jgi:MFS transporter, ACS family, hexuronate transporter